ncbi:hypothetical protein H6F96_25950 [Microcoleus sp. FACHB-53]|nr:hypothetical protein [Microcoleus sp. FACHB-53]
MTLSKVNSIKGIPRNISIPSNSPLVCQWQARCREHVTFVSPGITVIANASAGGRSRLL